MKYILVIPDGAADEPIDTREGKTIFELAATPTLDAMSREGRMGVARTIADGLQPGSDVANLALLGYDVKKVLTGRAALEAAALGVEIPPGDAVFRANLVTVAPNGIMADYSAGHITNEESHELIANLQRDMKVEGVKLFPGVGYRHLCLMETVGTSVPVCTPPHEIVGESISEHLPHGQYSSWVLEVERASAELLPTYEVNQKRIDAGKNPATQLWLWGGATKMSLDNFPGRFGLASAGLISAVDLLRGTGKLAGMEFLQVPGATGYLDTNYAGKGRAALDYIYLHDFVAVHVEAPDEAGHNRDVDGKVKALESIDRHILAPLYVMAKYYGDWRILVCPDHPTPVGTGKHSGEPIPFVLWGPGFAANGAEAFSEREAARVGGGVIDAAELMPGLFRAE